jgi:hypothetical protein
MPNQFFNSDASFFGGGGGSSLTELLFGGGIGPGFGGQVGLGGGAGSSPYLGASAFVPQSGSLLPASAGAFAQQFVPELAGNFNLPFQLGAGAQEAFTEFRRSPEARDPGAVQTFTEEFRDLPDVQGLIQRQQLEQADPFITGAQTGGRDLAQVVQELFETEGSQLANVFRPTGAGVGAVTEDIRRALTGGDSSLADLAGFSALGNAGQLTGLGNQATVAQLLQGAGPGLIGLGGGQAFNPFSGGLLTDVNPFELGLGGEIQGTELLRLTGGLLSKQDIDITQGVADAFQRSVSTGADLGFGGGQGRRLTQTLANLAPAFTSEGGEAAFISQAQSPTVRNLIDTWYGGGAGGGFGRGIHHDLGRAIQVQGEQRPEGPDIQNLLSGLL